MAAAGSNAAVTPSGRLAAVRFTELVKLVRLIPTCTVWWLPWPMDVVFGVSVSAKAGAAVTVRVNVAVAVVTPVPVPWTVRV